MALRLIIDPQTLGCAPPQPRRTSVQAENGEAIGGADVDLAVDHRRHHKGTTVHVVPRAGFPVEELHLQVRGIVGNQVDGIVTHDGPNDSGAGRAGIGGDGRGGAPLETGGMREGPRRLGSR